MFNLEHKTVQKRSKNRMVNLYTGVTEYLYLCCCISSILLLYLYFAQIWPPLAALPPRPLGRDGSTNLSAFLPGSPPVHLVYLVLLVLLLLLSLSSCSSPVLAWQLQMVRPQNIPSLQSPNRYNVSKASFLCLTRGHCSVPTEWRIPDLPF